MGEKFYVKPMMADWNNRQFLNKVIEPNIKRKTAHYLEVLEADQKNFAGGGNYEELGKSALRATLVPPISMSISLVLLILTAVKPPSPPASY